MRTELALSIAAISAATICGCSSVDVGRPDIDPNAAKVVMALVMDETNYNDLGVGLEGDIVDLLRQTTEPTCDVDTDPCTPLYSIGFDPFPKCRVPEGQPEGTTAGVCVDPLRTERTPPPVGLDGANQIRLVLSKLLDPSVDTVFCSDPDVTTCNPASATLTGPDGPMPVDLIYDSSGSPVFSTEPYYEPYGPALVVRPIGVYYAGASYTLRIDPATIKDKDGAALNVPADITFTTGGIGLQSDRHQGQVGATPDIVTATNTAIAPNDVIQLFALAPVDEAGTAPTAAVADGDGNPVSVLVWLDRGTDPADCAGGTNPLLVNIVRTASTSSAGEALDWDAGEYTISIELHADKSSSTSTFESSFVVDGDRADPADDPSAVENFVLPAQCE
ncbi:MAG: hypothetical protein IT384_11865 [Deltaproteobacteria bacterium]|nr:hypothetical protein [Deltaproteobacteria bacterium]